MNKYEKIKVALEWNPVERETETETERDRDRDRETETERQSWNKKV